jgi:hypothetical protein
MRMGAISMVGPMTAERTVQLPKPPSPVKRALINYFYDVLSTEN